MRSVLILALIVVANSTYMHEVDTAEGSITEERLEIFDADIVEQREGWGIWACEATLVLSCGVRQSGTDDKKNIHQSRSETELHSTIWMRFQSLSVS